MLRGEAALLAVACTVLLSCSGLHYRGSPEAIARSLLRETPLGSTEAEVLKHLAVHGEKIYFQRTNFPPSTKGYPESATGGAAYAVTVVGRYGLVFETSVEAFYSFDDKGLLTDITVRKTTDSL